MRRRRNPGNAGFSLMALLSITGGCGAFSAPQPVSLPQIDYDRLGNVLLGGSFDGISLLSYTGRSSVLAAPNDSAESIIYQTNNDTYVSEHLTNGLVTASCLLGDNHTAVIAGNFTRILNESVPGIAKLDLATMVASPLGSEPPQGTINALWCNNTEVYAGGSFEYNGSYGVACWDSLNNSWTNPNFGGFVNGSSVNTIIPYGDHILFGGTMKGLSSHPRNSTGKNTSELLHPGMQPVSFNFANATGFGSQGSPGEDASSILCPYSSSFNGWTASMDSTTGYINVTLESSSTLPTRIRLFNLPDGNGTKTFRLVTQPANGIMNLTYTDASGVLQSCSAYCPLPEKNDTVQYHDFEFVNVVPTTSLRIELLDFYGSRAGLRGIQLFQEGQYAYANEAFNLPRDCGGNGANAMEGSQTATATLKGNWTSVADYMAATITDKYDFGSTYAELYPTFNGYTVDKGHYAIQLWTPGCKQNDVCSQRGQVNVTVYPGYGSPQSTVLYQTNDFVKYDLVFNGTLQDGSYIKITPTSQNTLPMQLVAYKANLIYIGSPKGMNSSVLFEYSPANFSSNSTMPVGRTAINMLGRMLGNNASVDSLLLNGTTSLLIGGSNFASSLPSRNLLSLPLLGSANDSSGINGIGSGEKVSKIYSLNGTTFALSNKDTYNVSKNATSVGIGARANSVFFDLNGTSYWAFSPNNRSSNEIALWNPFEGFVSSKVAARVEGHLEKSYTWRNATTYLGSLKIVDVASLSGSALLGPNSPIEPEPLPFNFTLPSDHEITSSHAKRVDESSKDIAIVSSGMNAVYAGVYINSTQSIVAGHFNASVSNNTTATNIILINGQSAHPLPLSSQDFIDPISSFYAATSSNSTAVLGGNVTGKVSGNDIKGLLFYNGSSKTPLANQAPELSEDDMLVSALVFRPNSTHLIVGGRFSASSSSSNSSCNGLCVYDVEKRTWFGPESLDLASGGTVTDLVFETGDKLVIAGNFSVGDKASQVAVYDFSNNSVSVLAPLPGPVTSLAVLSNTTRDPVYAVSGLNITHNGTSPYLRWYNGSSQSWRDFGETPFQSGTKLSGLSLVTLKNKTSNANGPLKDNQGLLVSGQLYMSGDTSASVAIYDGEKWQGMYATTTSNLVGGSENDGGLINAVFSQYGGNLKGGVTYNEGTSKPHPRPSPSTTPTPPIGREGQKHHMPAGHVVGIACGIGIGCVMVLTLLYLLVEFLFNMGSTNVPYQNLAQSKTSSDPMAGTKVL